MAAAQRQPPSVSRPASAAQRQPTSVSRPASADQRRQRDQALAAATQRDTAESLVLLQEVVLRLTQEAARQTPTSAPTSRLTKLGPDDDVEAYLEVLRGRLVGRAGRRTTGLTCCPPSSPDTHSMRARI